MTRLLLTIFTGLSLLFLVGCSNNNADTTKESTNDTTEKQKDPPNDSDESTTEDNSTEDNTTDTTENTDSNDSESDDNAVDPNAQDGKVGEPMTLSKITITITEVKYTDERVDHAASADKVLEVTYTLTNDSTITQITGNDIHLEVDGEWMEGYSSEDDILQVKPNETREGLKKTFVVIGDGKPRLTFSTMNTSKYYNVAYE